MVLLITKIEKVDLNERRITGLVLETTATIDASLCQFCI